jgi:hypothetical protein
MDMQKLLWFRDTDHNGIGLDYSVWSAKFNQFSKFSLWLACVRSRIIANGKTIGLAMGGFMSRSVMVEMEMPEDLQRFRLPAGVNKRLQVLLDKQCRDGKLTAAERREAEGLVELAEMLSLLRLRSESAAR